jgi:glutamine amidotransferase
LFFTLITKRIDEHNGDVGKGIAAAASELAADVPLYSLNLVLTTRTELWAFRYPDTNELWILERSIGNFDPRGSFDERSLSGIMRVMSAELAVLPATVIASEQLDSSSRWRMLAPGELVHIAPDLRVTSTIAVPDPPAQLMDLSAPEAVAQGLTDEVDQKTHGG